MKKIVLILLATIVAVGVNAQKMRVWSNGQIEYQKSISLIDSITFVPESTPDPYLPGEELPEVKATAGAVTLVIKFDKAPCNGYDIIFVGQYENCNWEFATAEKFVALGDGWYKVVLRPGKEPGKEDAFGSVILGRPFQARKGIANWYYDWKNSLDDITVLKGADNDILWNNGFEEWNLSFLQTHVDEAAVVYVISKDWHLSPCTPYYEYEITVLPPPFCTGTAFEMEMIGMFNNWSDEGTVKLMQDVTTGAYTAKIRAQVGSDCKIRGVGSWDKEILIYIDDVSSEYYDNWLGVSNFRLDENLFPVIDYSNSSKYKWNICE